MGVRVHDLAKELGISSKELINGLARLKVVAKSHMSVVDDEMVTKIRSAMARARAGVVKTPVKARAASAPAKKPTAAVAKAVAAPAKPATKPAPAIESASGGRASSEVRGTAPAPSKPAATAVATSPAKPKETTAPSAPVAPAAPATELGQAERGSPEARGTAPKPLRLSFPITVKDMAARLEIKPADLIKHLMAKGVFAALTQTLNESAAMQVAKQFGYEVAPQPTLEEQLVQELQPDPAKLVPRAPVVTFMGHVDHGKTSLLDAIRKSKVTEQEAGGITQHIGAYSVALPKGRVTFLDTPGHEAFTALRARGANVTDVVVLVVAADDGVMPQTIEAIDHAKAADVPIVVAMNKIDKPEANPNKVKQQLAQHGLAAEDWGGKTIVVPVSAKSGQGIDTLLEMLLLEADLLELKADPTKPASGTVVEARLTKDRGAIATVLVQQGTLRVGELVLVGSLEGRVRAMIDDRGHRIKEALPGSPVEVLGLPGVPKAGDRFLVAADEKLARHIIASRKDRQHQQTSTPPKRITLEDLHERIAEGTLKELKLIIKADVQGSLEAITQSLGKIDTHEVKLNTIHVGVGDISGSDVMLAAASDAVVVGFHVGVDPHVQVEAITQGVDIRVFQIIYELVNAIRDAIEGLLEPRTEETFLGRAEVRKLFQVTKVGIVAGCMVTKGSIRRDAVIRVIRGRQRLVETKIDNLKRLKDDVREVQEGTECGISLQGGVDLQPGDLIEAWDIKKVARKLT